MPPGATSREAYQSIARAGKPPTQLARILAFIRHAGVAVSRDQIEHAFSKDYRGPGIAPKKGAPSYCTGTWDGGLPIPLASVCGRVNSVLEDPELRDGLTRARPGDGRRDPAFIRVAYRAKGERGHEIEFVELIDPAPVQRTFAFPEVHA